MNPTGKKPRRRLLRRFATALWALALALLLIIWIRSYWVYDRIHFLSEQFTIEEARSMLMVLRSGAGRFIYDYDATWGKHIEAYQAVLRKTGAGLGRKRAWARISVPVDANDILFEYTFRQGSGFVWEGADSGSTVVGSERRVYSIGAPYWFGLLILLLPAGVMFILRIRRNHLIWERRTTGRCIECGYDMRATPGRCPECGQESQPQMGHR